MDKDKILLEEFIKEINKVGFNVNEYIELKSIKRIVKVAIPIIMKYLGLFEASNYKDAMIDLLSVKGFYEATEVLLDLYKCNSTNMDKWNIGDALYTIQDKRFENEYIEIVKDKENERSRQMIVILLGRLRCEKSIPTLIDLLNDDDVDGHAIMALGYFKGKVELLEHIKPFLKHEKIWIRKQAEKAIKKINGK